MLNKPKKLFLVIIIISLLAISMLASYSYYLQATTKIQLRVFAASSLTNLFREYETEFEKQHNVEIIMNSGSSNSLSDQISQGITCDVFASASITEIELIRDQGLIFQNRTNTLLNNYIAVAVPTDNPADLDCLEDLVKEDVRIVIADFQTPIGNYTSKVLSKIESSWEDPNSEYFQNSDMENYTSKILANVISYEANSQQVVTKVMEGIADAGFVYVSDVVAKGVELQAISIPPELNVKTTYGIAVLQNSTELQLAVKFVEYVLSDEGKEIATRWGFIHNGA